MLVTEKEAVNKWCAPAMASVDAHGSPGDQKCLGSTCMAWRWTDKWKDEHGDVGPKFRNTDERVGYCGLAGRPEVQS